MWYLVVLALFAAALVVPASSQGVVVVTTFQYLADDVRQLICSGDRVYSLVPIGVDPHEYVLTPKDVELLRNSDLIISTSHTHMERKIYELRLNNELNASVIEIPKLPNINLRYIAGTNVINYHAVTYDPDNYIVLMKSVAGELSKLRPECSNTYEKNLNEVVRYVENLKKEVIITNNLTAVGSSSIVQYAVEWLGVRIITNLVVDPEASPTPGDISYVEKILSSRSVNIAIITDGKSHLDNVLSELALKHSIPLLKVPSPIAPGSTNVKLETVVNRFKDVRVVGADISSEGYHQGLTIAITLIALIILMFALRRMGTWK